MLSRLCLSASLLSLICDIGAAQVHRPASNNGTGNDPVPGNSLLSGLPYVDLSRITSLRAEAVASASESARAARYDFGPKEPPLYDPTTGRSLIATSSVHYIVNDPLPLNSSDVVAIGAISSAAAHISSGGGMIYSTFDLNVRRLIKGSLNIRSPIIIERKGGVALYPNGKLRFIGESGKGIPEANHVYLFFLNKIKGSTSYNIEGGFCVDDVASVRSLDLIGDRLNGLALSSVLKQAEADSPNAR